VIDGTVFDSSYDRGEPSVFKVNAVIQGWTEALEMMPVGSRWMLYIPSELAYKDNQRGKVIEPNMALIFDVELVEIVK
jgi:FKBP-type peptidyl-prolyl cis-trans isomerase FklB